MGEGVHELERLTARQLQQLIEDGISTAVVPFGSVEHHGGHLPLGADAILADAVGAEVARRLGDVGPSPGTYSGAWLTSVMLALRPDLVELAHASPDLARELATATATRGQACIERFTASVVASVRPAQRP